MEAYAAAYREYFARHAQSGMTPLDPAPRWVVWPGVGTVALGPSARDAAVAADIGRHTGRAIQWAEALGGWRAPARRQPVRGRVLGAGAGQASKPEALLFRSRGKSLW